MFFFFRFYFIKKWNRENFWQGIENDDDDEEAETITSFQQQQQQKKKWTNPKENGKKREYSCVCIENIHERRKRRRKNDCV